MLYPLFKGSESLKVLEVTYMMTHKCIIGSGQAKRVLQFRPACQKLPLELERQKQWIRTISSGSSDDPLFAMPHSTDGVIGSNVYFSVMNEKIVRDAA